MKHREVIGFAFMIILLVLSMGVLIGGAKNTKYDWVVTSLEDPSIQYVSDNEIGRYHPIVFREKDTDIVFVLTGDYTIERVINRNAE